MFGFVPLVCRGDRQPAAKNVDRAARNSHTPKQVVFSKLVKRH